MTRSLRKKATLYGVLCLVLIAYDIVAGLGRGWDWENLAKDVVLVAAGIFMVWSERRYYSTLAAMTAKDREAQLARLLPEDRARVLLKLKEYDV